MTLVEVTIGMVLFAGFATSVFLAVESSAGSYRTEATAARLDAKAREAMDAVTTYLREADFASISPPAVAAPASASSLDFQRAIGFGGGEVAWGLTERLAFELDPGEIEDGLDNDGDGRIDEGRIVWSEDPDGAGGRRTVLCGDVAAALEGESIGNNLDDNDNDLVDERGFCVQFVGRRILARITLEARDRDGNRIQRTATRAVTPRNTPEE